MRGADDAHDDGGLLAAAAAGEEWALTVLYRRHQPGLVQFLRGLAGGECEDLAAETWIDTARALSRFEGDDRAFRSLLFTIGRRRAVDHLRARGRRPADPADPQLLPESLADAGSELHDPATLFLEADASDTAVRRIGELLPPEQAEIVLLRVVGGLSVAETAEIVGRTPGAVSVIQTRALQRLARRLGEHGRRRGGRIDPATSLVRPISGPDEENLQDPDHPERWDG